MTKPPPKVSFRLDLQLSDALAPGAAAPPLSRLRKAIAYDGPPRVALKIAALPHNDIDDPWGPAERVLRRAALGANYQHPSVDTDQSGKRAFATYNRQKALQHDWQSERHSDKMGEEDAGSGQHQARYESAGL